MVPIMRKALMIAITKYTFAPVGVGRKQKAGTTMEMMTKAKISILKVVVGIFGDRVFFTKRYRSNDKRHSR